MDLSSTFENIATTKDSISLISELATTQLSDYSKSVQVASAEISNSSELSSSEVSSVILAVSTQSLHALTLDSSRVLINQSYPTESLYGMSWCPSIETNANEKNAVSSTAFSPISAQIFSSWSRTLVTVDLLSVPMTMGKKKCYCF